MRLIFIYDISCDTLWYVNQFLIRLLKSSKAYPLNKLNRSYIITQNMTKNPFLSLSMKDHKLWYLDFLFISMFLDIFSFRLTMACIIWESGFGKMR